MTRLERVARVCAQEANHNPDRITAVRWEGSMNDPVEEGPVWMLFRGEAQWFLDKLDAAEKREGDKDEGGC